MGSVDGAGGGEGGVCDCTRACVCERIGECTAQRVLSTQENSALQELFIITVLFAQIELFSLACEKYSACCGIIVLFAQVELFSLS